MTRVLIVGVSTRAVAAAAIREGFDVVSLDAFADLDQPADAVVERLTDVPGERFSPHDVARAAARHDCEAVVYTSNFENYPEAVTELAARRALWGNPPEVLARVRDPIALAGTLRKRGCAAPRTRRDATGLELDCSWLLKPIASGGGHGICHWGGDGALPPATYLQQQLAGVPGAMAFVAARGRVLPLGVTRQLTGDPAFGAHHFLYCGNILAPAGDAQFESGEALAGAAGTLARTLAAEYGLVGVNGVDFVARDGVPYAVEVNPRWSASLELFERASGTSLFGAHVAACSGGDLGVATLHAHTVLERAVGKAVVYAREEVVAPDTRDWLKDPTVADIPQPAARIAAGAPICTVFAEGVDSRACYAALVSRAERIYAELRTPRSGVAS